jgi:hypothetical protein
MLWKEEGGIHGQRGNTMQRKNLNQSCEHRLDLGGEKGGGGSRCWEGKQSRLGWRGLRGGKLEGLRDSLLLILGLLIFIVTQLSSTDLVIEVY